MNKLSLAQLDLLSEDEVYALSHTKAEVVLLCSPEERAELDNAYDAFVASLDNDIKDAFQPSDGQSAWDVYATLRVNGAPMALDAAPAMGM